MTRAIDFSRWAVVSYADETGLGRMAQDARTVLGLGAQLVFPSQRLSTRSAQAGDITLSAETPDSELEECLSSFEGVILLERPDWHPRILPIARKIGVLTAAVVMWEWFRGNDPLWQLCDLLICPNRKALEIVRACGFAHAAHLPWTLALDALPARRIRGSARLFFHNAGLVDQDDRKGTRETIEAFKRVKDPALRLIVRLQKPALLPELDDRIEVRIGNVASPAGLYREGEAAIQPSKLEGIGFMVLEPICSGIPTITQDIAPLNEYAQTPELLTRPHWLKRKAFSSAWVKHSHLRLPRVDDLARSIREAAETDLGDASQRSRAWAEEMFNPPELRNKWSRTFEQFFAGKAGSVAQV